jgi:MYXO-CTERM domain-containing protein
MMKTKTIAKTTMSLAAAMGALALAATSANAAITTVGIYDENTVNGNTVDAVAGGSSLDLAQTKALVASAWTADTGAVWNMDIAKAGEWDSGRYYDFALLYGAAQNKTLTLTMSSAHYENHLSQGTGGGKYALISGGFIASGGNLDRTWDVSEPLTMIAISQMNRDDSRSLRLVATLEDASTIATANTSGAVDTLHVLTASADNPIVSFTLDIDNYNGLDDLAFVVAVAEPAGGTTPEPSTAILAILGLAGLVGTRRRRRR